MGKREKVVIDTNVIVSGFGWGGKPEEILKLIEKGLIFSYLSKEIFLEISKVINYPKLTFTKLLKTSIIEFLLNYSITVVTKLKYQINLIDPDDDMFIDCAVEAKADYIISGKKHLLHLRKFENIEIRAVLKTVIPANASMRSTCRNLLNRMNWGFLHVLRIEALAGMTIS